MAAQKIKASTQHFTEIKDISESVVILDQNYACLVIEVQATNFALLSEDEQQAKILGYAALLNSLSFPIQILIRSKKMDISEYIKMIEGEIQKTTSTKLKDYIQKYSSFVGDLVKKNTVLDKNFYIALPFSLLEQGVTKAFKTSDFLIQAKAALHTKAESLQAQLSRLGLSSKVLEYDALITLFYQMFNASNGALSEIDVTHDTQSIAVSKKI